MNTSTGTREKNSSEDSEKTSTLKLVRCENPKTSADRGRRPMRIGVSSDLFQGGNVANPSPKIGTVNETGLDPADQGTRKPGSLRLDAVLGIAAAGLILGYFIGRNSRK